MNKWLTRNTVWLGALGSIASIIGLLLFFSTGADNVSQSQTALVPGDNSSVHQTQVDWDKNQHQDATIEGDRSTVFQRQ